jgi:hypothetical protein
MDLHENMSIYSKVIWGEERDTRMLKQKNGEILKVKILFLCGASILIRARNSRCTVITDLDTSKRSTQKNPLLM